jgi:hypothetical protein
MPHKLGLCGPKKDCSKDFLAYITGKSKNKKKIEKYFEQFAAVNFYCRKYAKKNKTRKIFSNKALQKYWRGGGHNYHVWHENPFNTEIKMTRKLKEICQVSQGKILKIKGLKLRVEGSKSWVIWRKDFINKLKIGDKITYHWAVACEKIN